MTDNKLLQDRRGSTLTNWVYVILAISLFLVLIQTQVLNPMNETYNKSISVGLSTDAQTNIDIFEDRAKSSSDDIENAEVSQLSDGITLLEIGAVAKRTYDALLGFVSGRFISELLVNQLDFPQEVATVLVIMIWMSLIFIIVRIFTRGVTP